MNTYYGKEQVIETKANSNSSKEQTCRTCRHAESRWCGNERMTHECCEQGFKYWESKDRFFTPDEMRSQWEIYHQGFTKTEVSKATTVDYHRT